MANKVWDETGVGREFQRSNEEPTQIRQSVREAVQGSNQHLQQRSRM